jgi:hypothetical protein
MAEPDKKNPNWGGARQGAGRPRLPAPFTLTSAEARLLLPILNSFKKDAPVAAVVQKLREHAHGG